MEKVPTAPQWDFMWTVVAEEAREKQFAHNAFTMEVADIPQAPTYEDEFLYIADAAMKVDAVFAVTSSQCITDAWCVRR